MKAVFALNASQLHELHTLYQTEWWSKGRTLAETKQCVKGSQICLGLIDDQGSLQGFARVLTDYLCKALILDIIVAKPYRGRGLGNELISQIRQHQRLKNVKHFELYCLPEMMGFYEKHGFSSDVGKLRLMRLENASRPSARGSEHNSLYPL